MDAKEIYKSLSQPPASALRQIMAGDLKGKTDINPQWRYEAMTNTFGLVGLGWKYEIQKLWTEPGANGETLAFAQVAVFVRDPDSKEWSDAIVGIGGSKLVNKFSNGPKSNDEGYKMAVTDAFSTSLKMLGVAADIYAGRWDGSKYNNTPEPSKTTPQNSAGPMGGPDTPAQNKRIKQILWSKFDDGSEIFSSNDRMAIEQLRMTKTADEVIKMLNEEMSARKKDKKEHEQKVPVKASETTPEKFPEDIPYEENSEKMPDDKDIIF